MRRRAEALAQWVSLGIAVGIACGCASALFLALLERVTSFRGQHEWLVYCLPLAGFLVGLVYERWGPPIPGGHNPINHTIPQGGPQLPPRVAPRGLVRPGRPPPFRGRARRGG